MKISMNELRKMIREELLSETNNEPIAEECVCEEPPEDLLLGSEEQNIRDALEDEGGNVAMFGVDPYSGEIYRVDASTVNPDDELAAELSGGVTELDEADDELDDLSADGDDARDDDSELAPWENYLPRMATDHPSPKMRLVHPNPRAEWPKDLRDDILYLFPPKMKWGGQPGTNDIIAGYSFYVDFLNGGLLGDRGRGRKVDEFLTDRMTYVTRAYPQGLTWDELSSVLAERWGLSWRIDHLKPWENEEVVKLYSWDLEDKDGNPNSLAELIGTDIASNEATYFPLSFLSKWMDENGYKRAENGILQMIEPDTLEPVDLPDDFELEDVDEAAQPLQEGIMVFPDPERWVLNAGIRETGREDYRLDIPEFEEDPNDIYPRGWNWPDDLSIVMDQISGPEYEHLIRGIGLNNPPFEEIDKFLMDKLRSGEIIPGVKNTYGLADRVADLAAQLDVNEEPIVLNEDEDDDETEEDKERRETEEDEERRFNQQIARADAMSKKRGDGSISNPVKAGVLDPPVSPVKEAIESDEDFVERMLEIFGSLESTKDVIAEIVEEEMDKLLSD